MATPTRRGRPLRQVWSEKDNIGVQDFVMLEHYKDEAAFTKNLRDRFLSGKLIYTYIGNVLVAVNPYEDVGVYSPEYIMLYKNVNLYELPPHIFAIGDQAYRSMRDENSDQCILISGESGAGKTESTKKILQFLALHSNNVNAAGSIRDRLLQCTPILEAFGNAKTIRNDNSSRFGKYMEIQFDFKGEPLGGRILNYLLEKSRVVAQTAGERNFHVFYHLLAGGGPALLGTLFLRNDPSQYAYLNQGNAARVPGLDDVALFREMTEAFKHMGFDATEIKNLYEIVASVLHIGQLAFAEQGRDHCIVSTQEPVLAITSLLGLPAGVLNDSLTHQTITARGQSYRAHLSRDKALYARDALGKALYARTFTWLIGRLNQSLELEKRVSRVTVMGLLDIYGFEIMQTNSFEQFCINYCNEKLQQVFVELTLHHEQVEYAREGIKWEAVDYFDNKIICDMVEEKHRGIIAILDEECLRPGDVTDDTFLAKMDAQLQKHKHYRSFTTSDYQGRKAMARGTFQISHYAGEVVYTVLGFIDKNNDLLFRDLKEAMGQSRNRVLVDIFPKEELSSLKRPPTAATHFKVSLNALIDILMAKTPWYVRCVKPNHDKRAAFIDPDLLRHQIKYLGLMENLRVRRAGFAYRRPYDIFLQRYKSLCPRTWPNYRGAPLDGVQTLLQHLKIPADEYRMGTTKIFIRSPQILFKMEQAFENRRDELAVTLQAHARGFVKRKQFLAAKAAVVMIAKHWRRLAAQRYLARLRTAHATIRRFIRGYLHRNEPPNADNAMFLDNARSLWLLRLIEHLPTSLCDSSWCPDTPPYLRKTSELLRRLCRLQMSRRFRKALSPDLRAQLAEKLAASELFRDKKVLYPNTIATWFAKDRLQPALAAHPHGNDVKQMLATFQDTTSVRYVTPVTKYDRSSYKPRPRVLLLTSRAIYFLDHRTLKLVTRVEFASVSGISLSKLFDTVIVLHTTMQSPDDRGDFVMAVERPIELATLLGLTLQRTDLVRVVETVTHNRRGKSALVLTYQTGPEAVEKTKIGLTVRAPALEMPEHYKRFLNPPPKPVRAKLAPAKPAPAKPAPKAAPKAAAGRAAPKPSSVKPVPGVAAGPAGARAGAAASARGSAAASAKGSSASIPTVASGSGRGSGTSAGGFQQQANPMRRKQDGSMSKIRVTAALNQRPVQGTST